MKGAKALQNTQLGNGWKNKGLKWSILHSI